MFDYDIKAKGYIDRGDFKKMEYWSYINIDKSEEELEKM